MFAEGFLGYGSSISVLVFLVVFALSLLYIRVLGGRLVRFR
jgi:ABC-type sugar transport system permease subunit